VYREEETVMKCERGFSAVFSLQLFLHYRRGDLNTIYLFYFQQYVYAPVHKVHKINAELEVVSVHSHFSSP
jgi:hypothetical protein